MALGNLFKSLFGGGSEKKVVEADPVEYKGFQIFAEPMSEGGQYRTAGRIAKEVDGVVKQTGFIRADNNSDRQASVDHCLQKAKQIIDEQGDGVIGIGWSRCH